MNALTNLTFQKRLSTALTLKGITVRLGTVSVGAIGFMSIRNKYRRTLVNPIFALLIPGHDLFYILEALL